MTAWKRGIAVRCAAPERQQRIGILARRVALSVRASAGLMVLSVLAMAVFRYVVALG